VGTPLNKVYKSMLDNGMLAADVAKVTGMAFYIFFAYDFGIEYNKDK